MPHSIVDAHMAMGRINLSSLFSAKKRDVKLYAVNYLRSWFIRLRTNLALKLTNCSSAVNYNVIQKIRRGFGHWKSVGRSVGCKGRQNTYYGPKHAYYTNPPTKHANTHIKSYIIRRFGILEILYYIFFIFITFFNFFIFKLNY